MEGAVEDKGRWSIRLWPEAPLLALQLGDAVQLGAGFAHLREGLSAHPSARRLARPLGLRAEDAAPRLVCLWGDGEAALPGADLTRRPAPRWAPAALWVDRGAYLQGDAVHVVLLAPGCGLPSAQLTLGQSSAQERAMSVALHSGVGHLELRGLPPGRWVVRCALPWPDAARGRALLARFTVLETEVLPLTARWLLRRERPGREARQRELSFAVALESFGELAQGPTRVTLEHLRTRERQVIGEDLLPDAFGVLRGRVTAQGAGPFALTFDLKGATRRSAGLALPAREGDQDRLEAGALLGDGALRAASLEESSTALGLHVASAEAASSPFLLDARRQPGEVRVLPLEDSKATSAMIIEPLSGRFRVQSLGPLEAGQEQRLPIHDPLGIVVLGARLGEDERTRAWEGWGVWATQPHQEAPALTWLAGVHPDPEAPDARWVEAGERPLLQISPARPGAETAALLLITHQRDPAPPGAPPGGALEALGRALLDHLRALLAQLSPAASLPSLYEAAGGEEAFAEALRVLQGKPEPPRRPPPLPPRLEEPAPPLAEGRDDSPLLVRVLTLGEPLELRLPPMPAEGRVQVQVIALGAEHWSLATAGLRCGAPVGLSWHLPAFVNPGDQATGRVELRAWGRPAALWLTCDGLPVPLTLCPDDPDEEPLTLDPGARLPHRARLRFAAAPGRWALSVGPWRAGAATPPADPWLRREGVISVAGRAVWLARRVRCLQRGDRVPDGDHRNLRLLPSLEPVLQQHLRAICAATWETCESLAARLLALTLRLLLGQDDPDALLKDLLWAAGCLRALFLPGAGWAARDPAGPPDDRLGELATRHLLRLATLLPRLRLDELAHRKAQPLLEGAAHLGQRAALAAGMVLPPPPESVLTADDADLLLRTRPARLAVAAATARARLKRRASARDLHDAHDGRLSEPELRAERAFAARVLLETQEEADRHLALHALARACDSSLRGPLAPLGGWSTADSAAVALVLFELFESEYLHSDGQARRAEGGGEWEALEVVQGRAWITWDEWQEDDLSDPASLLPLQVSLHRRGSRAPETRFQLGDLLDLEIDLGAPPQGGARPGDWLEVHLPAALAPVHWPGLRAERGGRLLRIDLEGRPRLALSLRAVATTGVVGRQPAAQHFALALRNMDDPRRGRGMLGLDVTIQDAADLSERLRRGVQDLLR
jgi:hypothetical protein